MASVARRPDGRWRARYRDADGREHARSFDRKLDADRWAAAQRVAVDTGRHVNPRAGRETLHAYATRWLAVQAHHRAGTRESYGRILQRLDALHNRPRASIRRSDVQGLVADLSSRYQPRTVRVSFAVLRAVLNAAVDDGLITSSPCARVTLPEIVREQLVPLTPGQVRLLADTITPRYRALVLLAGGTGLRLGEALGLTLDRVDWLRRSVKVDRQLVGRPPTFGPVKCSSSVRVVPAPTFVLDELSAHLRRWPAGPGGLIFTSSSGGPVSRAGLETAWKTAVRDLGGVVGEPTFHGLRHAFASVLIDGGESVTVVASRLGHANPSETLRTYSHLFPDSDERTRSVIDNAFSEDHADSVRTSRRG